MLKNRVFEAFGKERNLSKKERNLSRKERNLSREVRDLIFRLKSYGWRALLFSLQMTYYINLKPCQIFVKGGYNP